MRYKGKYFILLIPVIILISLFSCRKPDPARAIVTVVIEDTTGAEHIIEGAWVKLYSKPNGSYIDPDSLILDEVRTTNSAGFVEFQKDNDCILNLTATYTNANDKNFSGKGIAIFKVNEVYEVTVKMD